MEVITSAQNPKIKRLLELQQKSQERRKSGLFVVEGRREIERCINNGYVVDTLFWCPEIFGLEEPHADGARVFQVSADIYNKVAYRGGTEGIIAEVVARQLTLEDLQLQDRALVVVMESVEKPGNVGAVLRSADAANVDAVIVCDPLTDLFNPNTIRASLGTIFSLPVCADSSETVVAWLKKHQFQIYAAIVDGAIHYTEADFTRPCAIALGSEAWGLTEQFRGEGIQPIFLPMNGIADSLNVSTTAAILFYEALRQREKKELKRV